MVKTLILIRHAHRDTSERALDNGLSGKGREQAKAVRRFFMSRFQPEDLKNGLWLVSSPKLRCVETVLPLAKALDRAVDSHPQLDEQGPKESFERMQERVQAFIHEWTRSPIPTAVVCSHGDWLPLALFHLLGLHLEPKKGSWMELEWSGGRANLKWYIPTFKHFYS